MNLVLKLKGVANELALLVVPSQSAINKIHLGGLMMLKNILYGLLFGFVTSACPWMLKGLEILVSFAPSRRYKVKPLRPSVPTEVWFWIMASMKTATAYWMRMKSMVAGLCVMVKTELMEVLAYSVIITTAPVP